jgi:NosR/NirI family transcriptional regulator, nitrous oxide reductase regulator
MRILVILPLIVLGGVTLATGQPTLDPKVRPQFDRFFPSATSFSPKGGDPPHFKAFANQTLLGFVFWTTDLEPLERGYDGPIRMLVGMNTTGVLTGVLVVDHREPYGSFSVDPMEFAAQFNGKSIRDPFKVGVDVDAVSRASITIGSATRAIRNSSRRLARQLLTPPTTAPK